MTLGSYGRTRQFYVYMLTVIWPPDDGLFNAYDVADLILKRFYPGVQAGCVNMDGRIMTAEQRPLMIEKDWHFLPVHMRGWVDRATVQYP